MPAVRMDWIATSRTQFELIRQRASDAGKHEAFRQAHAAVVNSLRDLSLASQNGEKLYNTRLPGGEVRHWLCGFLSVCYVLFPAERVGWILKYSTVPASWPDEN